MAAFNDLAAIVNSGFVPMTVCQTACKPGSVRAEARDDHSSGTRLAARLTRPTRTAERESSCALRCCRPYSVLLPVGFTLPPLLPGARCALAAPFRPCPRGALRHLARAVCFLWHFPWGRPRRRLSGTVFPWSPDFPLPLTQQRPSGRLAGATNVWFGARKQEQRRSAQRAYHSLSAPQGVLGGLRDSTVSLAPAAARPEVVHACRHPLRR